MTFNVNLLHGSIFKNKMCVKSKNFEFLFVVEIQVKEIIIL